MDGSADAGERGRLYWRCRRGMRELDLLLQGFLDGGYDGLDAEGRRAFVELLDCPDALLYDYLLGSARPSDPALAAIVRRIRGG